MQRQHIAQRHHMRGRGPFLCADGARAGTPNTVYYGTDRLYRSTDMGTNNSVVSQAPLVSGSPISAIAISPQDDNYRIVGLRNGGLFYTTTGSSTMSVLDPTGGQALFLTITSPGRRSTRATRTRRTLRSTRIWVEQVRPSRMCGR